MASLAGRLQWPFRIYVRRIRGAVNTAFSPRYLLLTNTAISVGLSGLGDSMQQRYEILRGLKSQLDYVRLRNMCIVGLVFGPCCHYWYQLLDRLLPTRSVKSVIKKIAMDCFIMGPGSIIVFFTVLGTLQRKSRADVIRDWSGKGIQILIADFVIWPPTEFISFRYLPLRYRVFYDNAVSLTFDNYYSYIMYRQDLIKKNEVKGLLKSSSSDDAVKTSDTMQLVGDIIDSPTDSNNTFDNCSSESTDSCRLKYVSSELSSPEYDSVIF